MLRSDSFSTKSELLSQEIFDFRNVRVCFIESHAFPNMKMKSFSFPSFPWMLLLEKRVTVGNRKGTRNQQIQQWQIEESSNFFLQIITLSGRQHIRVDNVENTERCKEGNKAPHWSYHTLDIAATHTVLRRQSLYPFMLLCRAGPHSSCRANMSPILWLPSKAPGQGLPEPCRSGRCMFPSPHLSFSITASCVLCSLCVFVTFIGFLSLTLECEFPEPEDHVIVVFLEPGRCLEYCWGLAEIC